MSHSGNGIQSISIGFRAGFDGGGICLIENDFQSAIAYRTVVDDYNHHELSLGKISEPYSPSMCPDVHIYKFEVIPKDYQQDKWRLITEGLTHSATREVICSYTDTPGR